MCPGVPGIVRKKNFDAVLVKLLYHLNNGPGIAGHILDKLVLVPAIHAHVGVGGPKQNRIDPAVTAAYVGEILSNRVLSSSYIIEVPIMSHGLWLNRIVLGPVQRAILIDGIVVINGGSLLGTVALHGS
jgi:hypothetical protein